MHLYCRITDSGVRYLVDGPSAGKLRELNLTNCIRVGDIALVNIHKRFCLPSSYLYLNFYTLIVISVQINYGTARTSMIRSGRKVNLLQMRYHTDLYL